MPPASMRAQIGDGGGKHERQFLRFRSAGIVYRTAIGEREWALEAAAHEAGDHFGERLLNLGQEGAAAPRVGDGGERLIVETEIDLGGST